MNDSNDPEDTRSYDYRSSQKALTEPQIQARLKWASEVIGNILKPEWCYQHLIWTDICNTILPRTQNMQKKRVIARRGKKNRGSKRTKKQSKNYPGGHKLFEGTQRKKRRKVPKPILERPAQGTGDGLHKLTSN